MDLKESQTKVDNDLMELNAMIIDSIQDIKGKNIVLLDLTKLDDSPTDYFIVCEGESNTQVVSIANNVKKKVRKELGVHSVRSEGEREGKWVLIDYFNTVVHVFYPETRAFYDLEDLWSDAKVTEYENV